MVTRPTEEQMRADLYLRVTKGIVWLHKANPSLNFEDLTLGDSSTDATLLDFCIEAIKTYSPSTDSDLLKSVYEKSLAGNELTQDESEMYALLYNHGFCVKDGFTAEERIPDLQALLKMWKLCLKLIRGDVVLDNNDTQIPEDLTQELENLDTRISEGMKWLSDFQGVWSTAKIIDGRTVLNGYQILLRFMEHLNVGDNIARSMSSEQMVQLGFTAPEHLSKENSNSYEEAICQKWQKLANQ